MQKKKKIFEKKKIKFINKIIKKKKKKLSLFDIVH